MLRAFVSVLAALLFACSPPLDSAFAGHWWDSTGWYTNETGGNFKGDLSIAVSGNTATITKICLDGTGSVDATGSGDYATWSGSFACPRVVQLGNCAFVITYTSATATLTIGTPDTLYVEAKGSAVGCSKSGPLTAYWNANK